MEKIRIELAKAVAAHDTWAKVRALLDLKQ